MNTIEIKKPLLAMEMSDDELDEGLETEEGLEVDSTEELEGESETPEDSSEF